MHIAYLETKNLEDEEKDNPMEEWNSEMRAAEKGNWIKKINGEKKQAIFCLFRWDKVIQNFQ